MHAKHPQKIGRYEIICELEQGGMSTVYYASDTIVGRHVAIKILPRSLVHHPESRARFEREARLLATIEHPSVVPVYDFGEEDGQPYLVMQYMKGGTLGSRLRRQVYSLAEGCDLLVRLSSAIDKVHKLGIVHRDLKPDNILFDEENNPYIADFGIAKLSEGGASISGDHVMGTLAYASPEHLLKGDAPNTQSDIYALGVILFEMITGELPFKGNMTIQLIKAILSDPIPRASQINASLPRAVDALIARAMAKNPLHRYQTATEFAQALQYLVTTSVNLVEASSEEGGTVSLASTSPKPTQEYVLLPRPFRRWLLTSQLAVLKNRNILSTKVPARLVWTFVIFLAFGVVSRVAVAVASHATVPPDLPVEPQLIPSRTLLAFADASMFNAMGMESGVMPLQTVTPAVTWLPTEPIPTPTGALQISPILQPSPTPLPLESASEYPAPASTGSVIPIKRRQTPTPVPTATATEPEATSTPTPTPTLPTPTVAPP